MATFYCIFLKVHHKDPETNMYPIHSCFAAAGNTSDLDFVYYLLRRNPLALHSSNICVVVFAETEEVKERSTGIMLVYLYL
jgi:hypothetical protein